MSERPGDSRPYADAAGFVLAGGRSSRMGQDKALVPFAGSPLIAHALGILRGAGLDASIAGARSGLAGFAPVIEDAKDSGPLGGICAALAAMADRHYSARWAVFLPVDLPLLPPSLVQCLLDHARITGRQVTVASVNGKAQTFPAVVDRAALSHLEGELRDGRRACFSAFQAAAAARVEPVTVIAAEMLAQCGQVSHPDGLPAARWFLNVNTPADLQCAGAHCKPPIA